MQVQLAIEPILGFLMHRFIDKALFECFRRQQMFDHGTAELARQFIPSLRDEPWRKRQAELADVFRFVWPEQHLDGQMVGHAADQGTDQGHQH